MKTLRYFTIIEWSLWLCSILAILSTSLYFGNQEPLAILASLIGITSLIVSAKGNPVGQGLIIIFSVIYAYLALRNNYYSELITNSCLILPMAIFSLLSWLNHPFQGKKAKVSISQVSIKDYYLLILSTLSITILF